MPNDQMANHLHMFVLDVIDHGEPEALKYIIWWLNDVPFGWRTYWHQEFTVTDVKPAIEHLMRTDGVRALLQDTNPMDGDSAVIHRDAFLMLDEDPKTLRSVTWGKFDLEHDWRRVWLRATQEGRLALRKWKRPDPSGS